MKLNLPKLKEREKKILRLSVIALVLYAAHVKFFYPFYKEFSKKQTELNAILQEKDKLELLTGKIEFLNKHLVELQNQNTDMKNQIERMRQNLMTQGQVSRLLNSLEREARVAKVELVGLDITTMTEVTKKEVEEKKQSSSAVSVLKTAGGGSKSEEETVEVTYFKNVIDLMYRSNYRTTAQYLDSLLRLPFAISYSDITLTRSDTNPAVVDTHLGIEIFFQK